jgi:hypothetical protein
LAVLALNLFRLQAAGDGLQDVNSAECQDAIIIDVRVLGRLLVFSQRTPGRWARGVCENRVAAAGRFQCDGAGYRPPYGFDRLSGSFQHLEPFERAK